MTAHSEHMDYYYYYYYEIIMRVWPKCEVYIYILKNISNGNPPSHCYRKPEPAGNHDTGVRLSVMVGREV